MRSRSTSERGRAAGAVGALLAGLALAGSAHADVWGYIDARGAAHFASEALDDRYELFFRGGPGRSDVQADPKADTPRAVHVPTAQNKLLAYFDVAPGYKSIKHHLREASGLLRLDYELLKAVIATESGFDATVVSPRGAVGLMQVMPPTAGRYGVVGDATTPVEKKLTDPRTNILTGARYLRYLLDLFDDQLELALAAYNAGEGAVQRAGRRVPDIRETRDYVRTVTQLYTLLKPPPAVAEQRRLAPPRTGLESVPGGALGRRNMIEPLAGSAAAGSALSALERNAIEYP